MLANQPADFRPAPQVIFAALGDETRLALVAKLARGRPQSVTQLTEGSQITRQAISKHLRVLEQAGLVEAVRVGRESRYQFKPNQLEAARTYLNEVSRLWDDALGRLEAFLERE